MFSEKIVIYWVRRDFRLLDNPALFKAVDRVRTENLSFLPVFILDPQILNIPTINVGYPRRLILSKILASFAKQFERFSIILGKPEEVWQALSRHMNLEVFTNDDYEPYALTRDQKVRQIINQNGSRIQFCQDQFSTDPDIKSSSGTIYSVFTPYKKAVLEDFLQASVRPKVVLRNLKYFDPQNLGWPADQIILAHQFDSLESLQNHIFQLIDQPWICQPDPSRPDFTINLDQLFTRPTFDYWYTTEAEALRRFEDFCYQQLVNYKTQRDSLELEAKLNQYHIPDQSEQNLFGIPKSTPTQPNPGPTSHMSLALKWGLVSARTLKQIAQKHFDLQHPGFQSYISELIWREFYKYLLYHRPDLLDLEFQPKFQRQVQWVEFTQAKQRLEKWIRGETGYDVVDAAMNQIAKIGWMHNRSRMIVASVLCKNLGVDWRWGQNYFRAVLVDMDEASNNGGWQWAASVGADPKPIRIFNPYLQSENYDKSQSYRRKWLNRPIDSVPPIVEHQVARAEALKRYGLGQTKPRDF
jgi:deoxyribodipyrimidine photo-lyase